MISKPLSIEPTQRDDDSFSDEVRAFASKNRLTDYIRKAIASTEEIFAGSQQVSTDLRRDEYGDTYVSINAVSHDEPEIEAEKYSLCMEKWSAIIPPELGSKIRLSTSWGA